LDLEGALADIQSAPRAPVEEVSGPLPQVDILPPPPEPALSERPTIPARAARTTAYPAAPSAPAAESEPRPVTRRARLGGAFRRRRPAHAEAGLEPIESKEAPTTPAAPPETPTEAPSEPAAQGDAPPRTPFERLKTLFRPGPRAKLPAPEEGASEASPPIEEPASPEAPPLPNDDPDETAEKIFAEIGLELRRRRELLSLTPEEVDHHIHVRDVFIRALERGDFSQLPSAVQTRGMLANYATFLDLDTDALLLRFADSLQASHRVRYPVIPGKVRQSFLVRPKVPSLRSFMAGDLIFGLLLVVMVVALIVWGLGRIFTDQAETVTLPTAPSISDVLAGTSNPLPSQEVTLIPVLDTPVAEVVITPTPEFDLEVPPADSSVPVRVTIVAVERAFMRVMLDGEEAFNGRVVPGAAYTYEATTTIEVLTGNGAALRVTYNGRDLGLLGTFGQVANYIYTANAIVTPLPPVLPTSTPTRPVSPTPTLSPTVTLTPTQAPP